MVDDLKLLVLNEVITPGPTPGPVAEPPTFEPPTFEPPATGSLPPSPALEPPAPPAPPAPTTVVYETVVSVFSDDFSDWTPAFSFGLTSNGVEVDTVALGTSAYKVEFAAFGNFYLSCSGVCLPTPTDPAPSGQSFHNIVHVMRLSCALFSTSIHTRLFPSLCIQHRSSILCCCR